MPTLLIVHHTPSPACQDLLGVARVGATDPAIEGVDVVVRAALAATASDVLAADGYLLGTPANLGYMSGALKHFFDTVYNPCLERTAGRPWGLWVHGSTDTTGARLAVQRIVTGLRWEPAAEPLELVGRADDDLGRCAELGAVVAATLMA